MSGSEERAHYIDFQSRSGMIYTTKSHVKKICLYSIDSGVYLQENKSCGVPFFAQLELVFK